MKKVTTVFFACFFLNTTAYAVDGVTVVGGSGTDANLAAISLTWDWEKRWFTEGSWFVGGYWELMGMAWKGDGSSPEKELYAVGLTPVFRLQRAEFAKVSPYVEAGVGVYQFSGRQVHGDLSMGTRFEFGSHLGLGFTFGERQQYDLSYRFQHFSNAGISTNNPGINFNEVRFGYHF